MSGCSHGPAAARIAKHLSMRPIPLRRVIAVGTMGLARSARIVDSTAMPSVSTRGRQRNKVCFRNATNFVSLRKGKTKKQVFQNQAEQRNAKQQTHQKKGNKRNTALLPRKGKAIETRKTLLLPTPGINNEERTCNTQVCDGVCVWTAWGPYGACTPECEDGIKIRRRTGTDSCTESSVQVSSKV